MKVEEIAFTQDPHCCAPSSVMPKVELKVHDGGGGEYLVLNATEWAMDTHEEIDELARAMKTMLGMPKPE